MQSHAYRPNAAVARVNARVTHAWVGLTKLIRRVLVQNANDFIEPNLRGGPGQRVAAARAALRLHLSSFIHNPHQFAGVGDRQTFALSNLSECQLLPFGFSARQLYMPALSIYIM